MKKVFFILLSLSSIICMIMGLFLKKENLINFGFYLHFIDATYVSLEEYNNSKKFTFKTMFYPSALLILTTALIYQYILANL